MCLILFAWQTHPAYRLVLAANRDEFYARPTAPAEWWPELPGVLAGRDLAGGGTWFGIDRQGRWAAVTNFRDPAARFPGPRSRGLLVRDYLAGDRTPLDFLREIASDSHRYHPFNLLAGDTTSLGYFGSRDGPPGELASGVYGLSNALLDTPWPKVAEGKSAFAGLLGADHLDPEHLFAILADRTCAPPERLPDTGVGRDWERQLSPRFIRTPEYGTRSSMVLLVGRDGHVRFSERTFGPGAPDRPANFSFATSSQRP